MSTNGDYPDRYFYRCDHPGCVFLGYVSTDEERGWATVDHELDSGHERWATDEAVATPEQMRKWGM